MISCAVCTLEILETKLAEENCLLLDLLLKRKKTVSPHKMKVEMSIGLVWTHSAWFEKCLCWWRGFTISDCQ